MQTNKKPKKPRVFLRFQMLTVESAIEQLAQLALLFYRRIVFVQIIETLIGMQNQYMRSN